MLISRNMRIIPWSLRYSICLVRPRSTTFSKLPLLTSIYIQHAKFASQAKPPEPSTSWANQLNRYMESTYPGFYRHYRQAIDAGATSYSLSFTPNSDCWRYHYSTWTTENLIKIVPLFVAIVIPFGIPLIILSMIIMPRIVLTRHFWTPLQTHIYHLDEFGRNARYIFPKIITQLKSQSKEPSQLQSLPIPIEKLSELNITPLDKIPLADQLHLKRLYKVPSLSLDATPLVKRAQLLQILDTKMVSERERIAQLDSMELKQHLYMRKLNYENMDIDRFFCQHDIRPEPRIINLDLAPSVYIHAPILIQAKPNLFYKGQAGMVLNLNEVKERVADLGKIFLERIGSRQKKETR